MADPENPKPLGGRDPRHRPGSGLLPHSPELEEQARQRELAAAWIRENWKVPANCAVCGQNNWQIGAVFELRSYQGGALVVGGSPILPVFPVTCNVCGNTVLINAVRAGIITTDNAEVTTEGEQPADEAGAQEE